MHLIPLPVYQNPPGVFSIMNDAVATAHADSSAADSKFCQSLSACAGNQYFDLRGDSFVVKHYAGYTLYSE
jgi:myosin-1